MRFISAVGFVGIALLVSSGCSQADRDEAKARAERMEARTKQEAKRLEDKTKDAASEISDKTKSALDDHQGNMTSAREKLEKGASDVKAEGRRAGVNLRDGAITAKVKTKLAADVGLNSITNVSVETSGHIVTLRGAVASQEKKQEIERATLAVDGVTKVNNELVVR